MKKSERFLHKATSDALRGIGAGTIFLVAGMIFGPVAVTNFGLNFFIIIGVILLGWGLIAATAFYGLKKKKNWGEKLGEMLYHLPFG